MYIFKAETRESNIKMQNVFNRLGYELAQRVEGYYDNPKETAYKYVLKMR
jgi:ribosomal-protein-alanine N-acetyltransferase